MSGQEKCDLLIQVTA